MLFSSQQIQFTLQILVYISEVSSMRLCEICSRIWQDYSCNPRGQTLTPQIVANFTTQLPRRILNFRQNFALGLAEEGGGRMGKRGRIHQVFWSRCLCRRRSSRLFISQIFFSVLGFTYSLWGLWLRARRAVHLQQSRINRIPLNIEWLDGWMSYFPCFSVNSPCWMKPAVKK